MSHKGLRAPRNADLSITFTFPATHNVSTATPQLIVRSSLGSSSALLTVGLTATANGSVWTRATRTLNLLVKAADLAALPEDADVTAPWIGYCDVRVTDADGLLTKLLGGPFRVDPVGASLNQSGDTVFVELEGSEIEIVIESSSLAAVSEIYADTVAEREAAEAAATEAAAAAQATFDANTTAYTRTLLDDTTAAAARATLDAPGLTDANEFAADNTFSGGAGAVRVGAATEGDQASIYFTKNDVVRAVWGVAADGKTFLARHDDSGVYQDSPIEIDPDTGVADFEHPPTHDGAPFMLGVGTLAALEALAAGVAPQVSVASRTVVFDGYAGVFLWISGDQSANVTADPEQGVWVAPSSDDTGASGAWRRVYDGPLNVRWFGAVADSTLASIGTDNQAAIEGAIAYAVYAGLRTVHFPGGAAGYGYAHSDTILLSDPGVRLIGDGAGGVAVSVASGATTVGRGSISGDNSADATVLIGTFSSGPQIHIQNEGCHVDGICVARSNTVYAGSYEASNINRTVGILVYPEDTASGYPTARDFRLRNLRVLNQISDGVLICDNVVSSRVEGVEVNYVKGHGFSVQGGSWLSRVNTRTRPGQVQINNCAASHTGGHGIKVGGEEVDNNDAPYRIEIINQENYYNAITTSVMNANANTANNFIRGENILVMMSALDGRDPSGTAVRPCLTLAGLNINLLNFRAVQCTTPAIYVDDPWTGGGGSSRNVVIDNLYVVNSAGGAGYFNPAVQVSSNTRGIRVSCGAVISGITSLMTRTAGTFYWEEFNGAIRTDMDLTVDDLTLDDMTVDAITAASVTASGQVQGATGVFSSSATITRAVTQTQRSRTEQSLNDDQAGYFTFSAATRGILTLNGNTSAAKSAVIAFRCGDGSAYVTVLSSSGGVTGTTGALAGTTGVDGELTISADTSNPRLYIENRTGGLRSHTPQFLSIASDTSISSFTTV